MQHTSENRCDRFPCYLRRAIFPRLESAGPTASSLPTHNQPWEPFTCMLNILPKSLGAEVSWTLYFLILYKHAHNEKCAILIVVIRELPLATDRRGCRDLQPDIIHVKSQKKRVSWCPSPWSSGDIEEEKEERLWESEGMEDPRRTRPAEST